MSIHSKYTCKRSETNLNTVGQTRILKSLLIFHSDEVFIIHSFDTLQNTLRGVQLLNQSEEIK